MSPSTASTYSKNDSPVHRVAYLVVPHLAVAVERRERPRLASAPVIVAGTHLAGSGTTVLDCSSEALGQGVRPGMALSRAEQVCPEAAFLSPRLDLYRAAAVALFQLLDAHLPAVEQAQPGGLYLDLQGIEGRDAEAMVVCQEQSTAIIRELGLEATVGVAVNKFSAEVASLSIGLNRVLVLTAGTERAFLGGFPVSVLPVDEEAQRRLQLFGLRWLEQFARLPPAAVLAQFGWEGQRAHRLARGQDDRPVVPGRQERSEQASQQFEPPLDNLETLVAAAAALAAMLAQRLAAGFLRAGRLAVEAQCASGQPARAQRTLADATADAGRLARLAEALLRPLAYSDRIEALTLTLSDLSAPSLHQLSLWHSPQEQAAEAHLRRLAARYGSGCFQRSALVAPEHRLAGRRYVMVDW